jgi:error-prone DNA polymerase
LSGAVTTRDLERLAHETPVTIGGLVVARQRPGTAKGIVFILLEDEFGTVNLIVPPPVYERHRLVVRSEPLLLARGRLEKLPIAGGAINVYVRDLRPLAVPASGGAEVVALPDRTSPATASEADLALAPAGDSALAPEAVPALAAVGAGGELPADGVLADFRGVAPAVQSFAAGRRR